MNRQVTCLDCKADVADSLAQLIAKGKAKANGTTTDDMWRCNRCHTVKSRMNRYFKNHEDMKNAYNELAPYEKNEIIASSCLLYTSPSPRDGLLSRMPSSA